MSDIIKEWFTEAKTTTKVFNLVDSEFIIYKGFKILKVEDVYTIYDVRLSNMYSSVTSECFKELSKKGFIKGADYICFKRNKKRVVTYKKRAEVWYDKRRKYKKELPNNRELNEKRIRNINRKIEEAIDHMFLYKIRINQYKSKYSVAK